MTAPRPTGTSAGPPGEPRADLGRPGARPAATSAATDDAPIGERALSKLRWRCRRGLLENDLFIERFFNRHASALTGSQANGLLVLMDLPDNDLLDLLLGRTSPSGPAAADEVVQVLRLMRAPA